MKKMKKMMALVIAMVMVLGTMVVPAMAAAPEDGSITVNSPIVGATYNAYKVFDMTTNEAVDAFSYTINVNNPFYGAVVAYFNANKGLTLTRAAGVEPATYNVSVVETGDNKFDPQDFGKEMQKVLAAGSPAVTADADKGIVAKDAGGAAITTDVTPITVDVDKSDKIKFDDLPLGYYLINPTYPSATPVTVTMGTGENEKTFTVADLETETDAETGKETVKEPYELKADAKTMINQYVEATVTDAYVDKYLSDHSITTNKDGSPLDATGKGEYKNELIASMKADAEQRVLAALSNNGSEADINVKEPILVFLDSSQPDAVINEKNELDKWDIPVNPDGIAEPGTPDHGEPKGGKNIVVQEDPILYADWSEASIGDSIHYQLRVNAMNFIQDATSAGKYPQQVKEYILADYQSDRMHLDDSKGKGIQVSVWQGDNNNDSQGSTKSNVTKDDTGAKVEAGYIDYTNKADVFFKNGVEGSSTTDVLGTGTGIVVPWVKVSEANAELDTNFPIYTQTNVPKVNIEGQPIYKTEEFKIVDGARVKATTASGTVIEGQYVSVNDNIIDDQGRLLDADNNPIQDYDTYYVYSLYNSDVTIVVDYWMILDDDAIVDEPGNKNYAQYGVSTVDNKDDDGNPKKPEKPNEEDKPDQKKEVDEATVYTYAIAWVKVDNKANSLAGATFQLPFYVKYATEETGEGEEKTVSVKMNGNDPVYAKDGNAYIFGISAEKYEELSAAEKAFYTNTITTDETGVITIKGLKQGTYSITETEAPEGFNPLTAPFEVQAKKSGEGVTTKTETIIYLDENGNVTKTETSTTVTKTTDTDSYNNASATSPEETSVPVYQFNPIVNQKGTELPSTGGIGTTIFYVVGGLLAVGAGVVLVTKKRMSKEEN